MLYTFIYLQGSQTMKHTTFYCLGFTPLFTYKVLKRRVKVFKLC